MQFIHKKVIDAADFDDTLTQMQWYQPEHVSQLIHFLAFGWLHMACSQAAWWSVIALAIIQYYWVMHVPVVLTPILDSLSSAMSSFSD